MFQVKKIIIAITIFFSTHAFASSEMNHLYLGFLSRHQPSAAAVEKLLLSPVQSYRGSLSGLEVQCFWTISRENVNQYIKSLKETAQNEGRALSFEYKINWGMEYQLPAYSGRFFNAGTSNLDAGSLNIHRACVSIFPNHEEAEQKVRTEIVALQESLEKAQTLISLLAILEKNPKENAKLISELNLKIKFVVSEMQSKELVSIEAQGAFLKLMSSSADGSPEVRSQVAFQVLLESLVIRRNFIPEHRYGDFLSRLYDIHAGLVGVSLNKPVVWTRNQIWTEGERASFVIDFKPTTKTELCENYFAYSLPIFIHSLKSSMAQEFVATSSKQQVLNSIARFQKEIIPDLIANCAFKNSIEYLDTQLSEISNLVKKAHIKQVSEEQLRLQEWQMYFPQKPFAVASGRSLVDIFINHSAKTLTPDDIKFHSLKSGDFAFFVFENELTALQTLSRLGVRHYRDKTLCALGLAPILDLRSAAGLQMDLFQSCVAESGSEDRNNFNLSLKGGVVRLTKQELILGYDSGEVSLSFKNVIKDFSYGASPELRYLISKIKITGGRDRQSSTITASKLRSCDLPKEQITNFNYSYCDFERANLQNLNLANIDLTGANLDGADLRGADMSNVNLSGASVRGAIYSQTNSIRNTSGTIFPNSLDSTILRSMVSYEDCSWGYDNYCAQSLLNPIDCLRNAYLKLHKDIPYSCATRIGIL